MSSFVLKIIAIITMFMDHLGYAIYAKFSWMNFIGRLAFPIFAFQISEGYIHTKNLKKYFLRLFLFAIISQIPFMLFCSIFSQEISLNIFFTLLLGLSCIYIYDKFKYKNIGILLSTLIGFIAQYTNCDYGFYGIAIILLFYIFKNNILNANISFIFATLIYYLIPILEYEITNVYIIIYFCLFLFTLAPLLPINLYNGKKGINTKYLLYLFYPIHLLLLYGIHLILN